MVIIAKPNHAFNQVIRTKSKNQHILVFSQLYVQRYGLNFVV